MSLDPIAAAVAPVADLLKLDVNALAAPQSWYAINAKKDSDEAEVSIYDAIGAFGVSAKQFVESLRKINASTIHVRLNTPGGEVFDGTAIHNALVEHPANIVVHVDGLAASAGSYIAMAGNEVRMADNTYMMIHNAWGGAMGDASALQREAVLLEKMNDVIAGGYERKTGKPRSHWRALMDDETWFTAEEAKAAGLADIVEPPTKKTAANFAPASRAKFPKFNKIPDAIRAMWESKKQPSAAAPETTPETIVTGTAPEAPSRDVAPSETPQQEIQPMAESTIQTPPAMTPAAGPTVVQGNDNPVAQINAKAISDARAGGHTEGVQVGSERQLKRMRDIVEACPGNFEMAVTSFLAGHDPASVKLAFDMAKRERDRLELEADRQKKADALEIARLNAQIATGGHYGVTMVPTKDGSDQTFSGMTPKAQAEWEWENKPAVRQTAASKDIYVLARTAELDGSHRSFTRSA